MFELSLTHEGYASDVQRRSMAKGNLFEYFVTGKSSDPRDIEREIKVNKGKFDGLMKKTVDNLRLMADVVKKHIISMDMVQFKLTYDKDPRYIFDSHIDFLGAVQFPDINDGKPFAAIVDTKWTASINEVWNHKATKAEFLQGCIYVWQVYESTGKILPFVYVIAQEYMGETLVKPIKLDITVKDMENFKKNYIEQIINDKEFKPNVSEYNCLGHKSTAGKCRYFNNCPHGKALLTQSSEFKYTNLND